MTLDTLARSGFLLLGDAALRAVALGALVFAILAVFRVQRAADRMPYWRAAVVISLLMPLLVALLPALDVPVPAFGFAHAAPAIAGSPIAVTAVGSAAAESAQSQWSWVSVAFVFYLAGVTWLSIRLGRAMRAAGSLGRRATVIADRSTASLASHLAQRVGLKRLPRLAESRDVTAPVTTGTLRPVIVLPVGWRVWPADMLQAVLLHEFAHVARRDVLTEQLALVHRAVFWPSPLGWWLERHVSALAERASDEAALGAGTDIDPVRYAEILASFLPTVSRPRHAGVMHMARLPLAERRVERILDWTRSRHMSISNRVKVVLAITTMGCAWLAAGLSPVPVAAASAALAPLPSQSVAFLRVDMSQFPPPAPPAPPVPPAPPAPPAPPVPPVEVIGTVAPPVPPAPPQNPPRPPLPPAPPAPPPPPPDWAEFIPRDDFAAGALAPNTPGVTMPQPIRSILPKYTSNAMRQKVQGRVLVQAIVDVDGVVRQARVINPLHPELDEQALAAVRETQFHAGVSGGQAVRVWAVIEMVFRLH